MKSFLQSTCWAILLDSYGIANTLGFSIAITLVLILTTVAIYRTLRISNLVGEKQTIKKPPAKKRRERKVSSQSPSRNKAGQEVTSKHVAAEAADVNCKHCPRSVQTNASQCQKQGAPKVSNESKVMASRNENTRRIASNKGRSESAINQEYTSSETLKLTIENDSSHTGSVFAEKPRLRIASSSTIDTTVSDDISCGSTLVPSSAPFVPSPRQVGKVVQFDAKSRKTRKQEKASTRTSANADSRQQCQGKKAGRKDFINRRANESDVPSRWDALKPGQSASGSQQRVSNWSNRNARSGNQNSSSGGGRTGRSNGSKNASRAKQSSPAPMQPVLSTTAAATIVSPLSPPRVRTEYSSSHSFFANEQNRPSSWRGPPPGLESSFPYVPPVPSRASQTSNTNKWDFPMGNSNNNNNNSNSSGSSLVSTPSPTFSSRQTVAAAAGGGDARRNDFDTSLDSHQDSPSNLWRTGSMESIQENPCGLGGRTILDAPIGGGGGATTTTTTTMSQPWGSSVQPQWHNSCLRSSSTMSGSSHMNGSNRYQEEDSFFAMNRTTMHAVESTSVDLFHQLDSCQSPIVASSHEATEWVPRKTSFSRLRDNPFAPNSEEMSDAEHRIEAELQELGGQMVGSVLD